MPTIVRSRLSSSGKIHALMRQRKSWASSSMKLRSMHERAHARTWDTELIHALNAQPEQFPFLGDLDEHVRIASRDILPDGLLTQRDLPPMLPWNSRTLWLCWLY